MELDATRRLRVEPAERIERLYSEADRGTWNWVRPMLLVLIAGAALVRSGFSPRIGGSLLLLVTSMAGVGAAASPLGIVAHCRRGQAPDLPA